MLDTVGYLVNHHLSTESIGPFKYLGFMKAFEGPVRYPNCSTLFIRATYD